MIDKNRRCPIDGVRIGLYGGDWTGIGAAPESRGIFLGRAIAQIKAYMLGARNKPERNMLLLQTLHTHSA